jgi:non-ribosomal peptide synthetase component F
MQNFCLYSSCSCRRWLRRTMFTGDPCCPQVLLHKYTQQDDIVVGTPYANREVSEVHDVLGAFINTLALRADLAGDPSFVKLLGRAKAAAVQAFAHGGTPFAKVVETLGVVRSAAFTPIYQVQCSFQHWCGVLSH